MTLSLACAGNGIVSLIEDWLWRNNHITFIYNVVVLGNLILLMTPYHVLVHPSYRSTPLRVRMCCPRSRTGTDRSPSSSLPRPPSVPSTPHSKSPPMPPTSAFHSSATMEGCRCVEENCSSVLVHNSYLTVIGVHEMHSRMHPNFCKITILLVVMTHPLPIAGKLPIKTLIARQLPTNIDA